MKPSLDDVLAETRPPRRLLRRQRQCDVVCERILQRQRFLDVGRRSSRASCSRPCAIALLPVPENFSFGRGVAQFADSAPKG